VTGVIIADKLLNDENVCLHTYSRISKIPLIDLNQLERLVLEGLEYKTYIDPAEFS